MMPEIGHFCLILALFMSLLQMIVPLVGVSKHNKNFMALAPVLSFGQAFFVVLSVIIFGFVIYDNDFSVAYVVSHSNSTLPLIYKFSAIWAGHEGSLLLWLLILNGWTLSIILGTQTQKLEQPFRATLLAVMGIISFGFIIFLLTTSNPFARLLPNYPLEGRDLNPLLQDPGLIIHPPFLFLGYIGFSVPFAFAVSSLWLKKIIHEWIHWVRTYTLFAFSFLTIGITLGSWWAYYELGWGGWWFWDPVENASFMPWLTAIALLHSLIVADKRKNLLGITFLLAILCFTLSLIGTFLVRSGILTSIHAFASDPKRGIVFLQFLCIITGFAFILYGVNGAKLFKNHPFSIYSRESFILMSIALLLVSVGTILFGTLFPVIYEAIFNKKISVGFPYFNLVFVPLMIPLLIAVPFGPFTKWGQDLFTDSIRALKGPLILSALFSILILFFCIYHFHSFDEGCLPFAFFIWLGSWIAFGTVQRIIFKLKKSSLKDISLGAWGMCLAHFGVGIMVIGIAVVSYFQIEREIKIAVGESYTFGQYDIYLKEVVTEDGQNFVGYKGIFEVKNKGKLITVLKPEKRIFVLPGIAMSEAAIDPGFFRDIVVVLGDRLVNNDANTGMDIDTNKKINTNIHVNANVNTNADTFWSARLYYKPFVRWIWLGALLIALGAIIAALGKIKKTKI